MSNFRNRLLGLAGVAMAFAGVSYGQITCAAPSVTFATVTGITPTLRSESQTELVSDYTLNCTNTGTAITNNTAFVVATLSAPVTSKAVTQTNSNSDATITVTGSAPVQGTASGSTITFSGLNIPAGAFTALIQNVRVNATTGGNPQITESATVQYTVSGVGAITSSASANVGFITQSLGGPSIPAFGTGSATPYFVCSGNPILGSAAFPATPAASFVVSFKELLAGAFRTQTQENGSYVPAGANTLGIGLASSADQIILTVGNVPSAATIYVPQAVTFNGTTLTISGSTASTGVTSVGGVTGVVAFTPTSGTVTVTYTVTAAVSTGPTTFMIPVAVGFAGGSVVAAQGPITVNISYGPTGTVAAGTLPASVPLFAASTFTAANGSAISNCVTNILFPFITNQLGFDTGIVIANTGTDTLGFGGKSSVTGTSGICSLTFFGSTAPSPATLPDPQGSLATGSTHAFTVSSVAPGFQGYAIASCPFLYGHAFAFLTYDLTQTNGVAEGYLGEILSRGTTQSPESVTF